MIPSPIVTGADIFRARCRLSAAQLAALDTVSVVLAKGVPGKVLTLLEVVTLYFFGTTPYTFGPAPSTTINYGNTEVAVLYDNPDMLGGVINGATTNQFQVTMADHVSGGAAGNDLASATGQPLLLSSEQFGLGPILTVEPTPGFAGNSFAPGDIGIIQQDSNTSATYEIDTVDGSGGVLTMHFTTPGTGYYEAEQVGTIATSGVGTGLGVTLSVTVQPTGDGTVILDVLYQATPLS